MYAVRAGDVLAGKYRVDRILGVGGMGVVVAAEHMHLRERVAIKLLLPHVVAREGAVERFVREARTTLRIASPHVARIFDVGVLETGEPFIVMEYLEGTSLAEILQRGGPLTPGVAALYALQACRALAPAHALGIVHRDVKPANLMVTIGADGLPCLKVLDFGISKIATEDLTLTSTTAVIGSPAYMSPEHLRSSKSVDPRADVWALGVVLYQLVTGARPFIGDSLPELCVQIISADPVRPRVLDREIPEVLERVILRCLQKDRDARFPDMDALAAELEPLAAVSGRGSLISIPESLPVTQDAIPARRTRNKPLLAGIALALAGVLIAGAARVRGETTEPRADEPAAAATAAEPALASLGGADEAPAAASEPVSTATSAAAIATPAVRARGPRRVDRASVKRAPASAAAAASSAAKPPSDATLFRDRKW